MKTRILRRSLIAAGLLMAGFVAAPAAFARSHVSIGLGFYGPGYSVGYNDCVNCYYGRRAYYPAYSGYYYPAYSAPAYYYDPAPVYYDSYPAYGTVYYNAYYGGGYYGRDYYHHHHHDDGHWHHHDHDHGSYDHDGWHH